MQLKRSLVRVPLPFSWSVDVRPYSRDHTALRGASRFVLFAMSLALCLIVSAILPQMARAASADEIIGDAGLSRTSLEALGLLDVPNEGLALAADDVAQSQNLLVASASDVSISRLAGSTRFETMRDILSNAFSGTADKAIIATAEDFPDALCASSLAGLYHAPIILAGTQELPQASAEALRALKPQEIIIVGGLGVISQEVIGQIQEEISISSDDIHRCPGEDRLKTSLCVYDLMCSSPNRSTTAIVATGYSYADALSISPYAYSTASPVFLARGDGSLDDETKAALASGGFSRVVIVGGSGVVGDAAEKWLKNNVTSNVERLGGADRYKTSELIAAWSVKQGLSYNNMAVATGTNFPDALLGSVVCGQNDSVLLLLDETRTGLWSLNKSIFANKDDITQLNILGGTGVIPSSLEKRIKRVFVDVFIGETDDAVALAAVQYAAQQLGCAYSQAYRTSEGSFDCSSLAYYSYRRTGFSFPYCEGYGYCQSYAAAEAEWIEEMQAVYPKKDYAVTAEELKPGDWIFYSSEYNGRYKNVTHIAIYLGKDANGKEWQVEASGDDVGVVYGAFRTSTVPANGGGELYGRPTGMAS